MESSPSHITDVDTLLQHNVDQEKQNLRDRDSDQDHLHNQDRHNHHSADSTNRPRRPMASRRSFLLALMVCCFVTLGLANTKFHQSSSFDAPDAVNDGETRSLSSLLGTSEIRAILEKFAPAGHVAKRQDSNSTTSATPSSVVASSSSSASVSSSTVQTTPVVQSTTSSSSPAPTTPTSTAVETTAAVTETIVQTETSQAPAPTPTQTPASSASSTTSNEGTTLSTSSTTPGPTKSSTPSSTLVTATLTSTLPDGGISVVTQTSYSYVDPESSGTVTTPTASLQTDGAAPKHLLQPAMAAAVGGLWVLRNFV